MYSGIIDLRAIYIERSVKNDENERDNCKIIFSAKYLTVAALQANLVRFNPICKQLRSRFHGTLLAFALHTPR